MNDYIPTAAEIRTRCERIAGGPLQGFDLQGYLNVLDEAYGRANEQLEALHRAAGTAPLTASEQRRWDAIEEARDALAAECRTVRAQVREGQQARAAERHRRFGPPQVNATGFGSGSGPWNIDHRGESPAGWIARGHAVLERTEVGLSDEAAERIAEALATHEGPQVGQWLVARSNPHYESAFGKVLGNPERAFFTFTPEESAAFHLVESTRASLSTNVGTAGYLLPLSLDPNVASIANAGAASPFRRLAKVRTTASSPHRAVTSAGITASWVAENTAIGDASPTFLGTDVPLFKLAALVTASYEIFADAGEALRENLPMLLADARDVLEATAFVSGNGTSAPKGIVTAISATVASTVTATTRGSFTSASTVDTLALLNALSPRIRQSPSVAALANNTTIGSIRQQTIGTTGAMVTDLSAAIPVVLGVPFHESSAMSAATTSGTVLAVAGDLSAYLIVDHMQGPSLEFIPNMVDGSGVPTGTRGWVYWARTGADVLDVTKYRFLLT